jgi:hypothetical protein
MGMKNYDSHYEQAQKYHPSTFREAGRVSNVVEILWWRSPSIGIWT